MISQDVTGITIAELTLILLFVVLILFFIASPNLESNVQDNDISALKRKNVELEEKIAKLEKKIDENEKIIQDCKSRITPTCIEKGIIDGYLDTVVVAGRNRYRIGNRTYTYSQLQRNYQTSLEESKENECKHSIRVYFHEGLSADDYNYALLRLRRLFYTDLRGAL